MSILRGYINIIFKHNIKKNCCERLTITLIIMLCIAETQSPQFLKFLPILYMNIPSTGKYCKPFDLLGVVLHKTQVVLHKNILFFNH